MTSYKDVKEWWAAFATHPIKTSLIALVLCAVALGYPIYEEFIKVALHEKSGAIPNPSKPESSPAPPPASQQVTTGPGSRAVIYQPGPGSTIIVNPPSGVVTNPNPSRATQGTNTQGSDRSAEGPHAVPPSVAVKKPRIYLSFDENSRYVAQYIKEGLGEVGVPIETDAKEDSPRLATVRVQSEVRDFDNDGDVTTKMHLTISATKGDGTPVSEQNYDLSGTSTIDRESALRTASSKFRETAKNLELIKAIGVLARAKAPNSD